MYVILPTLVKVEQRWSTVEMGRLLQEDVTVLKVKDVVAW